MESTIVNEGGQFRMATGKGVNLYAAKVLMAAINLYLRTGMKASRMYTPTNMRLTATVHTGKTYKAGRKGLEAAAADIKALLESPAAFEGIEIINS